MAQTYKVRSIVNQNVQKWAQNLLLNNGYYNNIERGQTDFLGNDLSAASPVVDHNYLTNQYWRTPLQNWVYQSGISPPSSVTDPVIPSGVYINGTFYDSSDPVYGHTYDFRRGGIIFGSGLSPVPSSVQVQYAHKTYNVDFVDHQFIKRMKYIINNSISYDEFYASPSGRFGYIPGIYIQSPSVYFDPLSLGGGQKAFVDSYLWIIDGDYWRGQDTGDLFLYQKQASFAMFDPNIAPTDLDFNGYYSTNYVPYQQLAASGKYHHAFISDIEALDRTDPDRLYKVDYVPMKLEIWLPEV